jgi:hypothetical protein
MLKRPKQARLLFVAVGQKAVGVPRWKRPQLTTQAGAQTAGRINLGWFGPSRSLPLGDLAFGQFERAGGEV